MPQKVKISKIEAARRQMDTAIKLFFNDQDCISIHTLACAAHGVLNDLAKKEKIESMYEMILKQVRPDKKEDFHRKVNEARNFFKHADRDGIKKFLEYTPEAADFWIFDCCTIYEKITSEKTDMMKIFIIWFNVRNRDMLIDEVQKTVAKNLIPFCDNRVKFYQEVIPLIHTLI